MARRRGYNVELSLRALVDRSGDLEKKRALISLLRALAERPHTAVELLTRLSLDLGKPVKKKWVYNTLSSLEKKGVVKAERLLFDRRLVWSLSLGEEEKEALARTLQSLTQALHRAQGQQAGLRAPQPSTQSQGRPGQP